jgi:hypothetical protein
MRSRTNKSSSFSLSEDHCSSLPKRLIAEFMKAKLNTSVGGASEALKRGSRCPTLTALRQLSFRHADPQEPAATAGAPQRVCFRPSYLRDSSLLSHQSLHPIELQLKFEHGVYTRERCR